MNFWCCTQIIVICLQNRDWETICCIGGTSTKDDIANLTKNKPNIMVGTPGRILSMVEYFEDKNKVNIFKDVKYHVLIDTQSFTFKNNLLAQVNHIQKYLKSSTEVGFPKNYTTEVEDKLRENFPNYDNSVIHLTK